MPTPQPGRAAKEEWAAARACVRAARRIANSPRRVKDHEKHKSRMRAERRRVGTGGRPQRCGPSSPPPPDPSAARGGPAAGGVMPDSASSGMQPCMGKEQDDGARGGASRVRSGMQRRDGDDAAVGLALRKSWPFAAKHN
eukprot:TRINITY_DN120_c0_g2_i11.p4 TRINITY_DN120_c0_g2~~TRINITY_DN120_c0_g2_i11.p4  ORF type:complete len:140 (-),score=1.23 TRINITY_DN120_c0_g2_i11:182-601(-)